MSSGFSLTKNVGKINKYILHIPKVVCRMYIPPYFLTEFDPRQREIFRVRDMKKYGGLEV